MENWQFLIQKQGDHTWRTLESSNLKIWAGNYRILARSGLNNTDVDVRVTHISIDEVPPKRRLLKRSRRTNNEGLMAVIPFTHFKPGVWELRCSGDIMSDMLGQSWQRTLIIHVSPLETSPTLPPPLVEESEAVEADTEVSIVMNHGTPVWFKGETTEQILQNLLDLALPEDEPLLDEETIENAPTLPPPLLLNLSLDQDTYIVPWGDNFTIHGDVEVNEIENLADEEFSLGGLCQLRLEIALRSPLESKILNRIQQPLTNQVVPFGFSSLIHIPPNCESKLLLADINLYGALTDFGEVILLANYSFTITADVTELLAQQTLPSPSRPALSETNPLVKPKPSVKIRLELFNVAKTPNLAQFHILKPSPNQPLPPQIKPLVSLKVFSPQLPNLPQTPTPEITTDSQPNSLAKTLSIHPIDLKKLAIKPVNTTLPYLKRLQVKRNSEEIVTHQLDVAEKELAPLKKSPLLPPVGTSSVKIPQSPIDDLPQTDESKLEDTSYAELIAEIVAGAIADEGLNVVDDQDNYLIPQDEESNVVDDHDNYLIPQDEESNMVGDQEDSPLLQQWVDSQGYLLIETVSEESLDKDADEEIATQVDSMADNLLLELNEPEIVTITSPMTTQPGWLSQEIVIDDPVVTEDGDSLGDEAMDDHNYSLVLEDKAIPEKSGVMMESLPTPQLSLPEGELVAGTSVMVRVKIPEVASVVAVKLWVEDYQTRSLLDGPHILSDLRSNAWGEEETAIYLKVPFGCLEIRLSAIALDQTTQQESDRFTIIKTVIPPNLPTIEMDEMLGM